MEDSQAWAAVCLALACLTSWGSSMPLAAYQSSHVSGYPGALFPPQYPGYPPMPYFYAPGPASKSSHTKGATGTTQQYPIYSNPQGFPNHGYYFSPYMAPSGVFPVTQLRSPSPKTAPIGQLPAGGQYVIYPAGTGPFRDERQTLWQNVQNFLQGLRPNPSERPNPLNPLNWFGGNQPANPPIEAVEENEEETPGEGAGGPQPTLSNEVAEEEKPVEATVEEKPNDPNPSETPAEAYDPQDDVEPESAAVGTEEAQAEAAEITSRFLARSRYLPIVGFPRNIPRKRMGTTEGGAGGGAGAAPAGDDDVGEQEEEEEDSVVIGPGGSNPSVAQAKPAAIALAGVGGVAAAAPTATAVVGANGLAVSAPSATAIAGPSAGAPPPGLLPKFPTRRVPAHKVSPEEAQRNAAMIEAARRQAMLLASGLGNVGTSSYPSLPIMAYQVWRGENYGSN